MSYHDINRLRDAGYNVVEKSPWHFQVVGKRIVINVWPTKNKYMREYGDGASIYTDIVETIEGIFKPKKSAVKLTQEAFAEMMTPEREELIRIWQAGIQPLYEKA